MLTPTRIQLKETRLQLSLNTNQTATHPKPPILWVGIEIPVNSPLELHSDRTMKGTQRGIQPSR